MKGIDALSKQVEKMLDQALDPVDEQIGEMVHHDAHEAIMRKLAVWNDQALTDEQKNAACRAIDSEIAARHTDTEQQAIALYLQHHAQHYAGAKELLLQKLFSLKEVANEHI